MPARLAPHARVSTAYNVPGRQPAPRRAQAHFLRPSPPRARGSAAGLAMDKDYLTLKRASASRSSGGWNDDDFDVLCDDVVVGRIMKVAAPPVGSPWMWTLTFGHHEDRSRHTAMPKRARPRWRHSQGVGGGSSQESAAAQSAVAHIELDGPGIAFDWPAGVGHAHHAA
jgi:hypothetical protein